LYSAHRSEGNVKNSFTCRYVIRVGIHIKSKHPTCTRVVQKVLQMLGFHRYKRLILPKFVMLE